MTVLGLRFRRGTLRTIIAGDPRGLLLRGVRRKSVNALHSVGNARHCKQQHAKSRDPPTEGARPGNTICCSENFVHRNPDYHALWQPSSPTKSLPTPLGTAAGAKVADLLGPTDVTHRNDGPHLKASWIFTTNDMLANLAIVASGLAVIIFASPIPDLLIHLVIAAHEVFEGTRDSCLRL